jgi:hypothetical protein
VTAYIGTKIVQAEPMDAATFARTVRPIPGVAPDAGAAGYRVRYDDGYVSWSPRDVFERCYRPLTVDEQRLMHEP